MALASTLAGCAGARPEIPAPTASVERSAHRVHEATRLRSPLEVVFTWELNESGTRLSGRGVARMEPPYRARLDLFTEQGETAVRAALVDGELRLPPGVDARRIPPPPLLWSALGVFHPGAGAELVGGDGPSGGELRLRYALPDGQQLRYRLVGGVVRTAELLRDGRTVQRIRVRTADGESVPGEATYRNLAAFRELRVRVESTERVEAYPSDIWRPAR